MNRSQESPIWLLRKGKELEAEASMRRLRGDREFKEEFEMMKKLHAANMEQDWDSMLS